MSEPAHHHGDPYCADTPMWSGEPNGALVDVVSTLTPGRSVDVGCGEGADAVWLARQGWAAVGLDPSANALTRARSTSSASATRPSTRPPTP